jgi:EAL domain-containing protein (putative c-di-GMP-specific phosphodiesterase class I)
MTSLTTPRDPSPPTASIGFAYAFQPIVDVVERKIVSYEALIRGVHGEPASQVFSRVPPEEMYRFDAGGRVAAIEQASALGIRCDLNLNFLPQSLFLSTSSIESTLEAAEKYDHPIKRIVVEVTEGEVIHDHARFSQLINVYRGQGLKLAIDDFGAGYSGLNLLAEFQPDQIKMDMALMRGIESNGPRQAIVRAIVSVSVDLGIDLIAEGVETLDEFLWLKDEGIRLFQGYLFAKPGFASLPPAKFPS